MVRLSFLLTGVAVFMFGIVSFSWAQVAAIGSLVFTQGTVSLVRNGVPLPAGSVTIGTVVENLDLIKTGNNSLAEITFSKASGFPATMKLKANTTVSLDVSRQSENSSANAELIAGSVAFKVDKLTNGRSINVRTGSAVAGVRGTSFEMETGPQGELVLNTLEGAVDLKPNDSDKVYASTPGVIYEVDRNKQLKSYEINQSNQALFLQEWQSQRNSEFLANAGEAMYQLVENLGADWEQFGAVTGRLNPWGKLITIWLYPEQYPKGEGERLFTALGPDELAQLTKEVKNALALTMDIARLQDRLETAFRLLGNDKVQILGNTDYGKKFGERFGAVQKTMLSLKNEYDLAQKLLRWWALYHDGTLPR